MGLAETVTEVAMVGPDSLNTDLYRAMTKVLSLFRLGNRTCQRQRRSKEKIKLPKL